jgi:hypothetical protein
VERQVPLQLDLGYRITALWLVGVYARFGVGDFGRAWHDRCELSSEDFGSRYECAARVYRLGAQGQYRLFAGEPVTPWLGVGLGWEALQATLQDDVNERTLTFSGLEFLNVQAGLDLSPSSVFSFGPYAEASVAEYHRRSLDCEPELPEVAGLTLCESSSAEIVETAPHGWVTIGVRVRLGPL